MTTTGVIAPQPQATSVAKRVLGGVRKGARRVAEAIATPLLPEDFLDLISPLGSGAELRGRVLGVRAEGPNATTLTIRPGRGWRPHTPGQYVRIGFDVDGVRLWRAYSLTSPVNADTFTITARAIPDGKVSNFVRSLAPGTLLHLDQAEGLFTLPTPTPPAALFLTAGSGITPIMGMLRNDPLPADVVIVHSAPSEAEALFLPELRRLEAAGRLRLVTRFTAVDGILTPDQLDSVVPDWRSRDTWACGPAAMLDDAEAHWAAEGLGERLHTERFRAAIIAVGDGGAVTFDTSGVTVDADAATTLLDAGEDAGVLMPSGCRMGICFNCVLPLTGGSIRDLRTGEVTTADPQDPVLVQTCVSAAAGPCHLTV
ncbi:ferredoxin reductase [Tessaracoccus sp. MC1865]|uniref:ferredoxin reductase n=1 Tax=unclassified Tessaracoccus TaxID=2635419 RepID=UPI0016035C2F|nr:MULTISPECIES: ferredoxin reductase [unclassified Tessaracoccus]MBB1482682.1 ferredoxin reductase [Tessaracoccus sp. MC1865]MBB1509874.1 ferredoxin reductase [Tessaracoccus sp. MC1756]QTO37869.1 ferredoxin reductase [Tessaracoccus sp. MC1865]